MPISAAEAAEAKETLATSTNAVELFEAMKKLMVVAAGDDTVTKLVSITLANNERKAANGGAETSASRPNWDLFLTKKTKQLAMIPKLNIENWHVWLVNFKSVLSSNNEVYTHLFEEDGEPYPYIPELDAELVSTIRTVCDLTGSKNVSHILDRDTSLKGRKLFQTLKTALTKDDDVLIGQLDGALNRIKLVNNDVDALIHNVNEVAHRASLIGAAFTEREKLLTLRRCTEYTQAFGNSWETLESTGRAKDYDHVCNILRKKAHYLKHEPYSRQPRQAALAASASQNRGERRGGDSSQVLNREKWLQGKVDPDDPDAPPKCYNCHEVGHIAAVCPRKNNDKASRGGKANRGKSHPQAKAAQAPQESGEEDEENNPITAQASLAHASS